MASLNSYNFTGRLGRDPELRSTQSGTPVCSLSVAVDRFGDKPTLWVDVSVWGKAAENCGRFLSKGRQVAISGQVEEARAYMRQNGEPGASLSVSTRDVTFLGGDGQGNGSAPRGDIPVDGDYATAPGSDVQWGGGQTATPEDDIPF